MYTHKVRTVCVIANTCFGNKGDKTTNKNKNVDSWREIPAAASAQKTYAVIVGVSLESTGLIYPARDTRFTTLRLTPSPNLSQKYNDHPGGGEESHKAPDSLITSVSTGHQTSPLMTSGILSPAARSTD